MWGGRWVVLCSSFSIHPSGYFHSPVFITSKLPPPTPRQKGGITEFSALRKGTLMPVRCGHQEEKTPFQSGTGSESLFGGQRRGAGRSAGVHFTSESRSTLPARPLCSGARHGHLDSWRQRSSGRSTLGRKPGAIIGLFSFLPTVLLQRLELFRKTHHVPGDCVLRGAFPHTPAPRPPTPSPQAAHHLQPGGFPSLSATEPAGTAVQVSLTICLLPAFKFLCVVSYS